MLENCKEYVSELDPNSNNDINTNNKEDQPEKENTHEETDSSIKEIEEMGNFNLKNNVDYASSDLLCFFPKSESDNLVIYTIQDCYNILFTNNTAKITIEKEDFNMSLKTSGVQISNSQSKNLLLVTYEDSKYKILTNNQIEIPHFIPISKISKNEEFLEVELAAEALSLTIENNMVCFEEKTTIVKQQPTETVQKQTNVAPAQPVQQQVPAPTPTPTPQAAPVATPTPAPVQAQTPVTAPVPEAEITDNDTLIISDSNQKVILPYTLEELQNKMKKNKYYTLQEVIDKEYTIPMETFKNPIKSRFREAFQLIKKKEKGSLKEAIELGFELMFQSDLNPAIIAACKDLDELDIYLDCLDDDELDKFSCFKIDYDVPPTKSSKRGKSKKDRD